MTPGVDCDFALAHPSVNGGVSVGFFLVARREGKVFVATRERGGRPEALATGGEVFADFGPGPRKWKLSVAFEPYAVDYRQAAATSSTIETLREYYEAAGDTVRLDTPLGESFNVWFLALEERASPAEERRSAEITLQEAT